jgi:hypothetical protein
MKLIGFDLDNTVFDYSPALDKLKTDRSELNNIVQSSKEGLKNAVISNLGEDYWTELQGYLYTEYVKYVYVDPKFIELLKLVRLKGWRSTIISHKTIFPFIGPRSNMRESALATLKSFKIDSLLSDGIHFFSTKNEKISYINRIQPDFFIDDLPEVLLALSRGIHCILFSSNKPNPGEMLTCASSWEEVNQLIIVNHQY